VSVWKKSDRVSRAILIAMMLVIAWGFYISVCGGVDVRIFGLRVASSEWARPLVIAIALLALILIRNVRRVRPWSVAFAVGALIGVIIFLWIYLPAYRERHQFPEEEIINSLSTSLRPHDTMRPFMLLVIVILAWLPWSRIDRNARLWTLWFLVVSAIVFLVPLRFGSFSLWRSFFEPLPGFAAIRDPKRIIYLYELAVVLAAAALMMRSAARFRAVVIAIALVLMATNWNRETFAFQRPIAVYDAWVAAPIHIDPSCRSFFIKGASADYMSRSPNMWMLYGIDSMFVATRHSIPTLNGYSAWTPTGWDLGNPQEGDYPERVDRWIRRNSLTNVCAFDIERRTMAPHPALRATLSPLTRGEGPRASFLRPALAGRRCPKGG